MAKSRKVGIFLAVFLIANVAVMAQAVRPEAQNFRLQRMSANASGPLLHKAVGGYHWTISADDIFGVEVGNRLEVNARRYADGSVKPTRARLCLVIISPVDT